METQDTSLGTGIAMILIFLVIPILSLVLGYIFDKAAHKRKR